MLKPDRPHTIALMEAIENNDWEAFEKELPLANIRGQNNGPLRTALACGNIPMLERVFDLSPPSAEIHLLISSVRHNQLEAAQWIANKVYFKKTHKALEVAAASGALECLKWLVTLPQSHPKINSSGALQEAVTNNQIDCIQILLPLSNPKANFSVAAQNAALHNPHLLPLLSEVCNFEHAIHAMENRREPNVDAIERLRSFHTNKVLTQAISECRTPNVFQKKM